MSGPGGPVAPRRGEIYLVNFDPTLGAEIKKTRPALVIQNNVANHYSPIVIVAAVTSQFKFPLYPTEVLLLSRESSLKFDSVVLLNQIRSIDRVRLAKRVGALPTETMARVSRALRVSLALLDI